ncbi:MAG: ABC transporter permease [Bacteroidales bacterium]|nr:ABC transporter permease [Bacteroidales bacterium]
MRNLFIKLAIRNLTRSKVFSIINIFGLAIGISASLLIFQYVQYEMSYDKFHKKADELYRVRLDRYSQGELAETMATAPDALGPALKEVFPEVEHYAILSNYQLEGILSYEDQKFRLDKTYFCSEEFFQMFTYPLIAGDQTSALSEPNAIVLSRSLAEKFFGNEDPMGKILKLNTRVQLKVTGCFEDVPENTHLKIKALISMETMFRIYGENFRTTWWADVMLTYIKLTSGTNPLAFEKKLNVYIQNRFAKDLKEKNENMVFHLQPITSIHLYSNYPQEAEVNGNGKSVSFLLIISILILLIAWVNYINLSTARSMERARDVGLRKVSGATRPQLIRQFLVESLLVNIIAVLVGLIIVEISHPYFSRLTGLSVNLHLWHNPVFWILFGLVIIVGSILSGLYPAFVLSSFKPITVLKSRSIRSNKGALLRKGLILFQFVISLLLIAGTLTINKQIKYMEGRNLGIDVEQTLIVRAPGSIDSTWNLRQKTFKAEMLKSPSIEKMCASYFVPGDKVWYTNGYIRKSNNNANASRILNVIHVDPDFIPFYNLEIIAGRNFIEGNQTDVLCHILNEKAVELLGFSSPEEAIGQELETPNWNMTHKIVGVIANYHQESLREDFAPTIYTNLPHPRWAKQYSVKIHSQNIKETIAFAEQKFLGNFPGNTFEYFFLDTHFDEQYKADREFGKTFGVFAFVAIAISIMGLFALALYFTVQRNREIAVRKVLGANLSGLFMLLSRDYFRLLALSLIVAFPLSFLIMNNWLDGFAYRIQIGWWFFVIPVFLMSLVIFASVIYQIAKTASLNPVDSLKYE